MHRHTNIYTISKENKQINNENHIIFSIQQMQRIRRCVFVLMREQINREILCRAILGGARGGSI